MKDMAYNTPEPYVETMPKKMYPTLTMALDKFPSLNEIGKEVTMKVKARVKGVREDDQGGTVDVEICECDLENEKEDSNEADKELETMTSKKS